MILDIEFVYIRGGWFEMGDIFNEGSESEKPVHLIYIKSFYLSKYLITNAQYMQFVKETGYEKPKSVLKSSFSKDNQPVSGISWIDAMKFCEWLKAKTGKDIRLPSEAEWEFAARNRGKRIRYPWGNKHPTYELANHSALIWHTTEVGRYPPNELGIYDMAGNVWEWCLDWFDKNYYSKSPIHNPKGPTCGILKVLRGGSWLDSPRSIRTTHRSFNLPTYRGCINGFRVCFCE